MDDSEKLRRLSKYEARDDVLRRDESHPQMEFFSPFGPLIGRTQTPAHLIEHVNAHVDDILPADKGSEILLSETFCQSGGDDSLLQWVSSQISRYVSGVERSDAAGIHVQKFWIVNQYSGTPSPMHFHSGDISGVMYLKVPQLTTGQEQKNYISGRQSGYINFLIGGKQRFSRSLISFRPVVGEFLIFPAWLLHGAEPFQGEGERRSLAFNASVCE